MCTLCNVADEDYVCEDEQEDGNDEGKTGDDLDVELRCRIREDEDQDDQGRVESLICQHVSVEHWGLVRLSGNEVQNVDMRSHQNEDVLQEYILVVDR